MVCKSCFIQVDEHASVLCSVCFSSLHEDCRIKEGDTFFCDTCYTERDMKPKRVDFAIPEVIRRTYIETYRTCPHRFLKEVIEGHESPATCYTQIGIDLHDLFEKGLNDRTYAIHSMVADFMTIWDETYPTMNLFTDEQQKEDMYKRAMDSIETYYMLLPDIPIPLVTEQTIRYSIGEGIPDVEFTMDAVLEGVDGLELIDWKTGQVMVGKKLSSDLQAPLYIYGVQQHFKRPVKRFTFYYLKDNKQRVFEHVQGNTYSCTVGKRDYFINLDDAIKEVSRIFAQINKGNFNIPHDTKSMFFACKMCHLPALGLCEGADMQAWRNIN